MNNDTYTMTDDMKPREYQIEMLNESLKRNIIIALDTGSGKTHIAVLRLRHEAEREPNKARMPLSPYLRIPALLMRHVLPRSRGSSCRQSRWRSSSSASSKEAFP